MVKHPIANLYFMHVFDIRKCINKWITSEHECIRVMSMKMKLKFDKYWSTSCSSSLLVPPSVGLCSSEIDNDFDSFMKRKGP